MQRVLAFTMAFLLLGLFLADPLLGAQKKPDAGKDKDVDKNSEKKIKAGQVVAKVAAVYEDKKALRLTVSYQVTKPNQGAITGLAQAQISYQQAALRRDYNGMAQAQQQMAQHQRNMYTVENKTQDIEVTAIDEVVVRSSTPPENFDDKGKIKKYTKKELAELKGPDPKLPGYKAEFGDIQTEQIIQVSLIKNKEAPRAPVRKGKGKDADAEADLLGADHLPKASMIVILADPSKNGGGGKK